ncbi:MAG: hypothetical protein JEZ09_03975 [Salinivirgaceae bacterium]|nr:hypothetical protein [Salinivirgaceae bacterium]
MKEKLRQQLLAELSRRNIDLVTQYACQNPEAINYLVDLVIYNEETVSMRAAWALEKLSEKKNEVIKNRLPDILEILSKITVSGTRRTIAKVLMQYTIPEEFEGKLFDFCIEMIEAVKEPVAVKANCMTIVFNLLPKYPELKNEIFAIIEDQIPYNSIGFKSRFFVLKRKMNKLK